MCDWTHWTGCGTWAWATCVTWSTQTCNNRKWIFVSDEQNSLANIPSISMLSLLLHYSLEVTSTLCLEFVSSIIWDASKSKVVDGWTIMLTWISFWGSRSFLTRYIFLKVAASIATFHLKATVYELWNQSCQVCSCVSLPGLTSGRKLISSDVMPVGWVNYNPPRLHPVVGSADVGPQHNTSPLSRHHPANLLHFLEVVFFKIYSIYWG